MHAGLTSHHRDTLKQIFARPSSGNVEWQRVLTLLEAIGATTRHRDGKLEVAIGSEKEILQPPHGKDVDVQMLVDLRRMLTTAGFSAPAHSKER